MNYARIWLACVRYSVVRTLMFRFDFFLWAMVELLWMSVNLLMIAVIYQHTDTVAGWNKYQMTLLIGTSMLIQRFVMGFFWSNLFEMGRNIRTGNFDFVLAQPGYPLFMASTRKLDPDSLANSAIAIAVVIYSIEKLGLHPGAAAIGMYALMVVCGIVIHYAVLVMASSLAFWTTGGTGLEGGYFTLFEFSRLPREAFRGLSRVVFVWALPVVVVSYAPARTLLGGFQPSLAAWLAGIAVGWFLLAQFTFNRGIRRYASASS